MRRNRYVGSTATFKRHRDFVLIGFGEPEVDAIFRAVIIIVVEIDAGLGVVVLFQDASPDHLLDGAERGNDRSIRQTLDRFDAVLFQNALHPADGVALAVQQAADAPEQVDIVGAIVAPAAAPLHRLYLGES